MSETKNPAADKLLTAAELADEMPGMAERIDAKTREGALPFYRTRDGPLYRMMAVKRALRASPQLEHRVTPSPYAADKTKLRPL